jgi:hypothetical protein
VAIALIVIVVLTEIGRDRSSDAPSSWPPSRRNWTHSILRNTRGAVEKNYVLIRRDNKATPQIAEFLTAYVSLLECNSPNNRLHMFLEGSDAISKEDVTKFEVNSLS